MGLSRATSLEGLCIHNISAKTIRANPQVKTFYRQVYVRNLLLLLLLLQATTTYLLGRLSRTRNAWVGGWVVGWAGGRAGWWMDGWMEGWVDGWMDGWMDGWVD